MSDFVQLLMSKFEMAFSKWNPTPIKCQSNSCQFLTANERHEIENERRRTNEIKQNNKRQGERRQFRKAAMVVLFRWKFENFELREASNQTACSGKLSWHVKRWRED